MTEEEPGLHQLESLGFGQRLGRYTLLRRLAAGGMAEVYVARSNDASALGKRVAIKKILPQHSHNERFVEMLVDEAKITVSLAHPNIAEVHELAVDGDFFIVMELVDGPPLSRLIVRALDRGFQGLPIELAVHILAETARGLDHAHKQTNPRGLPLGIVHRDVTPQNILISHTGAVKLIDFGIARALGRAGRTAHGVIKGKLRYLAPEIANGEEPDWRADIYCCGIVLYEALTGTAMFSPTSDAEAIAMAACGLVRSPREVNPKIPEELERIVMRAVAKQRTARYQSAKDLAHDLRVFLNRHHPRFVEGQLTDFVQQMFAAELEHERRLDALGERYLRRSAAPRAGDEAPTIEAVEFPDRPSYKRLVSAARSLEHRPPHHLTDTLEERDTEPPDPPSSLVVDALAPTRLNQQRFDVQSDLTDLATGSGEYIELSDSDSALEWEQVVDTEHAEALRRVSCSGESPALSYPAEERSFSEEIEVGENTAPSIPRSDELPRELITDWRPKAFRALRSNTGSWSVGQWLAVLVCFSIGGVALAMALHQRDAAIVIPAQPAPATPAPALAVLPALDPVAALAVKERVKEEDEPEPETSKAKLGVLKIRSFPAATITIDGKKRGSTPKTVYLKPGPHHIQLSGPNGETREINRFVGRGKNLPINIYW